MKTNISHSSGVLTLLALTLTSIALAAPTTKKPIVKVPAKTPTKVTTPKPATPPKLIREVMGIEQLIGYEGSFGQTFTVGKETAVNFTLNRAEYSVNRVNIGSYSYLPTGDEKFLVLHFTIHNPLKNAFNFSPTYLNISAVDASGVTRKALTDMGREVTQESVYYNLKPAQKVEVFTAIRVSAYGEVPKLIVQNNYDDKAPIVRYDLRGKVAKLVAPYSSDVSGVTAPKIIPAKIVTFYPVTAEFDVRIDKIAFSTEPMREQLPEEGQRYCVAFVTIKNRSLRPFRYGASYFHADLKDKDGEKTGYNRELRKATRDEDSSAELAPSEEARARFYWKVSAGVEAKTILLKYGYDEESRTYAINVE